MNEMGEPEIGINREQVKNLIEGHQAKVGETNSILTERENQNSGFFRRIGQAWGKSVGEALPELSTQVREDINRSVYNS